MIASFNVASAFHFTFLHLVSMDIGLDVGVTACRAAAVLEDSKNATVFLTTNGDRAEPSCIYFAPKQRRFGKTAQIQAKYDAKDNFFTHIRRNLLDSDLNLDDALHYAMLVEHAFGIFKGDKTVSSVMFTVPVLANSYERQILKYIARTAVGVDEDQVRIINDTTAAAVAYGVENLAPGEVEKNVLIFSLGGGCLGLSLVDVSSNSVVVKEAYGERLGGDDFTETVLSDIRDSIQRDHPKANIKEAILRLEAERVTHSLATAQGEDVSILIEDVVPDKDFRGSYTQLKFRKTAKDLLDRIEDCLSKVKGPVNSILPVGGGSRMCYIDNLLKSRFESAKLKKTINAEEAAVSGAAIIAHHAAKGTLVFSSSPPPDGHFALQDISSHSVCLGKKVLFSKFSELPTSATNFPEEKGFLSEEDHPHEGFEIALGSTVELTCEGILKPERRLAELEGLAEALQEGRQRDEAEERRSAMWLAIEKAALDNGEDPAQTEVLSWLNSNEDASITELEQKLREFFPNHAENEAYESVLYSTGETVPPIAELSSVISENGVVHPAVVAVPIDEGTTSVTTRCEQEMRKEDSSGDLVDSALPSMEEAVPATEETISVAREERKISKDVFIRDLVNSEVDSFRSAGSYGIGTKFKSEYKFIRDLLAIEIFDNAGDVGWNKGKKRSRAFLKRNTLTLRQIAIPEAKETIVEQLIKETPEETKQSARSVKRPTAPVSSNFLQKFLDKPFNRQLYFERRQKLGKVIRNDRAATFIIQNRELFLNNNAESKKELQALFRQEYDVEEPK